jgi:hypothetical protein
MDLLVADALMAGPPRALATVGVGPVVVAVVGEDGDVLTCLLQSEITIDALAKLLATAAAGMK